MCKALLVTSRNSWMAFVTCLCHCYRPRGFRISWIWHGLLRWKQFSNILRIRGRTYIHYTTVGIAYYLFVQFYLYILTIFHVRINHTVGFYHVFSLFKLNTAAQSISFQTSTPHNVQGSCGVMKVMALWELWVMALWRYAVICTSG